MASGIPTIGGTTTGYNRNNNDWNNRYYGYHYRQPPTVYSTPYNYGYQPPPVIYDNTPGFTIRIQ